MTEYKVLARRYRPQVFSEIVGQNEIVNTLKNAIKHQRLAHAYLFCGSRGTGKTTTARVFAKALNCQNPSQDFEPCNQCQSCREIALGNSLDVLEIDGASHRGIDDIRQINETVAYASSSGKYKIYIIDEVHMLTKEAFNALLKTLEEPPAKVKFFFATTEPHKVLPTILSRCQRFHLKRISPQEIFTKLQKIANDLQLIVEEEALQIIVARAEGGLRDAESIFDQIIAFSDGKITTNNVISILGITSKEILFKIDKAVENQTLSVAFEVAEEIFSQGKDLPFFIENLCEHYRNLLSLKIGKPISNVLNSKNDIESYQNSLAIYTQEQCLTILDLLIEGQNELKTGFSPRIFLEALLLKIIRIKQKISVEALVQKLVELEKKLESKQETIIEVQQEITKTEAKPGISKVEGKQTELKKEVPKPTPSITIDPSPSIKDIPLASKKKQSVETKAPPTFSQDKISRYDTILQFAAVELEGTIQKK
ncbi:MAG: DNA polymerase III, subunit gamma and tau [Chlamydia sp. 32-24]|nr:MAG: DNA polymerase III, subunit gamma and tau [Chlamydia sp. 32-24]